MDFSVFSVEASYQVWKRDALAIIILVALVKNPDSTPAELSDILRRQGYQIDGVMIDNLLEHHGLGKKKLNTTS